MAQAPHQVISLTAGGLVPGKEGSENELPPGHFIVCQGINVRRPQSPHSAIPTWRTARFTVAARERLKSLTAVICA